MILNIDLSVGPIQVLKLAAVKREHTSQPVLRSATRHWHRKDNTPLLRPSYTDPQSSAERLSSFRLKWGLHPLVFSGCGIWEQNKYISLVLKKNTQHTDLIHVYHRPRNQMLVFYQSEHLGTPMSIVSTCGTLCKLQSDFPCQIIAGGD